MALELVVTENTLEVVQPTYLEVVVTENTLVLGGNTGPQGAPGNAEVTEIPTGDVDGVNKVFTMAEDFSTIKVYLGGLRQKENDDYTITDTNEITFAEAPFEGANIVVDYVPA